ncbi:MAG: ATP-binding protein, partial [Chloroflexi bacterium]|nr:ATP-binding protein [Chloroflexota bacterium]
PRLDVDPNRIRQVLDNLIDNAIEYSLHGTKIIVGAKKDKETNELIISVSDQGIGIDDNEIPKIFQRMYRIENRLMAKQSKKGLGLGLAICKALVEGHMGRIWVESKIGKGSIFYFSLPLFEAEKAEKRFLI